MAIMDNFFGIKRGSALLITSNLLSLLRTTITRRDLSSILLCVAAGMSSGCTITFKTDYNKQYVSEVSSEVPVIFRGKALVVTSPEDDQAVIHQKPSSWKGGGTLVKFESGKLTRDVALSTYGSAFEKGSEHSPMGAGSEAGSDHVIIEPRLSYFDYKLIYPLDYVGPKPPMARVRVKLDVKYRLSDGTEIDRQYDSGYVSNWYQTKSISGEHSSHFPTEYSYIIPHAYIVALRESLKDMETFIPKVPNMSAAH
jgi:hypothetical protein